MFESPLGQRIGKAVWVAVILLGVFLAVQVLAQVMGLRYIGAGMPAANTIVVSGHGESVAIPDIATFSFSVVSDKADVASAQADSTAKANATTAYLKGAGVAEKDIQTSDYSVQPQYDYIQVTCIRYPCPPTQQLKGYEVRQTTTVKVRDTKKAGELLAGVGSKGATEVSGLNFTFDDPTALQAGAREKAIADAKQKAEVLAKQLGVSLVRVTSFSENGGGYPRPMMYGLGGAADASKAAPPEISVGENKTTDDVSITYEIR